MEMFFSLTVMTVLIGVIMATVMLHVAWLTYFERKILGHMQDRLGPMEVGFHGLLQPIADGLKLFFKEDIIPSGANKVIFTVAPILSLIPALIAFAVIPFTGGSWRIPEQLPLLGWPVPFIGGMEIHPYVADINIAVLYILALSSIGAYGILLGGWASNSKYSLLGGLRSAAQVISYELPLGMSLVGVLLLAGSLSLKTIAEAQGGGFWHWYAFAFPAPQFIAFVIYLISAIAETNRLPFDLPEAESELVAGFFTEYSGMRFAFFFMAEYANMILVSCVGAIIFLGAWHPPFDFLPSGGLFGVAWLLLKVYALLFVFIWIRGTLPRLRYDQLMRLGWKTLVPLALANIVVTSIIAYFAR